MPTTVKYIPNSRPEPMLQKNNQIHKSGFHLHPHLPARRILSKRTLSGGSISFLLGTLSSLYDSSNPDIIEVSAEVVGDYVAWEDLQAFEHDEFEKEMVQKLDNKKEYEKPELTQMMGATVKRVKGRLRKNKDYLPGTFSQPRRKPTNIMEDLDIKSSKSQSPASSTESHSQIVKRVGERSGKSNQKPSQAKPQAQTRKDIRQPLGQFRQYDDNDEDDNDNDTEEDDPQSRFRRHRKPSQCISYGSNKEDENDDRKHHDGDDPPPQSQLHRKHPPPLRYSPGSNDNDEDHTDNDEKNTSKAEDLLRKFQRKPVRSPIPPKQGPRSKKFLTPSSIEPLNRTTSHHLPTHTRSIPGPLIERAEPSTPLTKTVRKPPLSLNKTLLSPSKTPSMTSPFPGLRHAVKKARLGI